MNAVRRLIESLFAMLIMALMLYPVEGLGQVTIDDFQMAQSVTGAAESVVGPDVGILGTFRTGRVQPSSSSSSMDIMDGEAAYTSVGDGGTVVLEWDGNADTATYDETGLGGVDLTVDDSSMPQVGITFDVISTGPYTVNVTVNTDEDHASVLTAEGTGPETATLLYDDFEVSGPVGGADFSNVGALLANFAGASNFTIGQISTLPDAVLAVELGSFEAVASGFAVDLKWTVNSESGNSGFDIEHRVVSDALPWESIGFVASSGDNNGGAAYAYRTEVGHAGRHQFRLRMIDHDGSFTYSPTTEVSIDVPGSFVLGQAYPNPFNPTTSFTLTLARGQNVSISVFDLLGRQVKELHEGFLEGSQAYQFRFDAGDLSTGIYVVKAAGEFESSSVAATLLR